jgi:hypothetical protein
MKLYTLAIKIPRVCCLPSQEIDVQNCTLAELKRGQYCLDSTKGIELPPKLSGFCSEDGNMYKLRFLAEKPDGVCNIKVWERVL